MGKCFLRGYHCNIVQWGCRRSILGSPWAPSLHTGQWLDIGKVVTVIPEKDAQLGDYAIELESIGSEGTDTETVTTTVRDWLEFGSLSTPSYWSFSAVHRRCERKVAGLENTQGYQVGKVRHYCAESRNFAT